MFSARKLCIYERLSHKKRGSKFKIDIRTKLSIKRKVMKKVWSSKLVQDLSLNVVACTVQIYLLKSGYKYKRAKSQIILSEHHNTERLKVVTEWITSNHRLKKTIFSDEKRFTLENIWLK